MTETLAHRYSSDSTQRDLSNEYQHVIASALEGLKALPLSARACGKGVRRWLVTNSPELTDKVTIYVIPKFLHVKRQIDYSPLNRNDYMLKFIFYKGLLFVLHIFSSHRLFGILSIILYLLHRI